VIPVLRGVDATRRCIESVLASTSRNSSEIVVIDDGSPELELVSYVRDLARRGLVTLLEQRTTEGCAASLNRAFELHRDRDKVLLQSDAEVAGDWLDRLSRHAAHADIGVVCTFTNAVGAATYPLADRDSPLPEGYTTATLDALFVHANAGQSAALPAV